MAGDVHIITMSKSFIQVFIVILCFYLAGSASNKPRKPRKPLYSNEDDVVILTYENFTENVYSSESAWFVGFFSSWCGHCRRFAPTWKKLATEIKGKTCQLIGIVQLNSQELLGNNPDENWISVGQKQLVRFKKSF